MGTLSRILQNLPKGEQDPNLLVGFDSKDDAAIYKVSDDTAFVQTLDFFPPMIEDPYVFGQIAAANALSDVYAMGGEVKTALNMICFPEDGDLNVLSEILRGGAEKVIEAGGVLAGGHSVADKEIKYGLSVTGIVHPEHIYTNNGCKVGDAIILTKELGTGIVCTANRIGDADSKVMQSAIKNMTFLNKYAMDIARKYDIHACTDVTGFGMLGHLYEMMEFTSCNIMSEKVPVIDGALEYAGEFYITAAGQKNRNYIKDKIVFENVSFEMQEVLLDPQTSGGLIITLAKEEAENLVDELQLNDISSNIIGEVIEKTDYSIKIT